MKGKEKFVPEKGFTHIGYGHLVQSVKVVVILKTGSSPLKKLKDRAAAEARLVDATCGHKNRSIIITDSNHVILSALTPETLWQRTNGGLGSLINCITLEDLENQGV